MIRVFKGNERFYKAQDFIKKGVFVGYRTIKDGHIDNWGDGENVWVSEKHHSVALVYYASNRKPVYVPKTAISSNKDK